MRMSQLSPFKKMIMFFTYSFFSLFLPFLSVSNNVHVFNAIGLLHGFSQILYINCGSKTDQPGCPHRQVFRVSSDGKSMAGLPPASFLRLCLSLSNVKVPPAFTTRPGLLEASSFLHACCRPTCGFYLGSNSYKTSIAR
jgi:hypothetical protein